MYIFPDIQLATWLSMLAVPSRTNLALVALTGRAVLAVRGVLSAASMVPGLAAWLPGRDTPLRGRPDWLLGLGGQRGQ